MGGIPSTNSPFFLVPLKRVCRYHLLKASFIAYHSKLAENSLFKMLVPPIFIPKCQSVCLMLKAAPGLVNYTLTRYIKVNISLYLFKSRDNTSFWLVLLSPASCFKVTSSGLSIFKMSLRDTWV